MRTIHCLFALFLTPTSLFAQTTSLQDFGDIVGGSGSTTIYVGKQVITMDGEKPVAEAVAVKDGRFLAVGTLEEVRKKAGKGVRVDRTFADKFLVAGFVEQHVHPVLAALTMNTRVISIEDWDTIDGFSPAVRTAEGYAKRLRDALGAHSDKSWPFVSWGYHHYLHGDQMSRAVLDELAPDFPVIIWHRSCHEFFLNSAALEKAGIDEAFVDSLPDSQRDQLNLERGHFYEQGAIAVLNNVSPMFATPEDFRKGLEYTETYYHRAGITVCCEPGGFFSKSIQDAVNAVYSDDATPFRHYFIPDGKSFVARNPEDAAAMVRDTEQVLTWGFGHTAFLPKQVKLFTDGAIYSQLMKMKDGYLDGHEGEWIMDPPLFDYAFQAYWDAGYQIHVHNNGDGGMEVLLASLEKAMKRKPRDDHRATLVHFGFAQSEQIDRWAELGGIVSANPYYVTALASAYARFGVGPERSRNMVPFANVLKNQIPLSLHSDMPMAPAKPLQLAWAAVNRKTFEGEVMGPRHRLSVHDALRAITRGAAHSIQMEDSIGTVTPGKLANLTVLEQNPYDVEPMELKNIPVWGTMLEGRVQPVRKSAQSSVAMERGTPIPAPRLNRDPRARLQSILNRGRKSGPALCLRSGCSCRFGHALAASIAFRAAD